MDKQEKPKRGRLHTAGFTAQFLYDILLTVGIVWLLVQSRGQSTEIQFLKNEVAELRMKQSECEERKSNDEVAEVQKREVLTGAVNLNDLLKKGIQGPPGPPGMPGKDGRDGRDAVNLASVDRHIRSSVAKAVDIEMAKVQQIARSVPTVSGAVYTRYGRTVCPSHSNLLYKGRVGGTFYGYRGGSSQYICLPDDPEYSKAVSPSAYLSPIAGAEYKSTNALLFGKQLHDHNVPCAVCQANTRANKIMIPAKRRCPDSSWYLEYRGFLLSEKQFDDPHFRTEYICVDEEAETVRGMASGLNGANLFHTSIDCTLFGSCPPYETNREITCVVCSK